MKNLNYKSIRTKDINKNSKEQTKKKNKNKLNSPIFSSFRSRAYLGEARQVHECEIQYSRREDLQIDGSRGDVGVVTHFTNRLFLNLRADVYRVRSEVIQTKHLGTREQEEEYRWSFRICVPECAGTHPTPSAHCLRTSYSAIARSTDGVSQCLANKHHENGESRSTTHLSLVVESLAPRSPPRHSTFLRTVNQPRLFAANLRVRQGLWTETKDRLFGEKAYRLDWIRRQRPHPRVCWWQELTGPCQRILAFTETENDRRTFWSRNFLWTVHIVARW
jgi:hypothetical protein